MITREDLCVDWNVLYLWVKQILFNNDESYALIALPKFVVIVCSATQNMKDLLYSF